MAAEKDLIEADTPKLLKMYTFAAKTKVKAKSILNVDGDADQAPLGEEPFPELEGNPAFNASKFLDTKRVGSTGIVEKTIGAVQRTAETIIHPKRSIKSRVTKTTAGKLAKGHSYLSRRADLDFLSAYDKMLLVQESRSGTDDEEAAARKEDEIGDAASLVVELEERRWGMRVAWISDRHMRRVKVVDSISPKLPAEDFFEEPDDCGAVEFRWGRWIAFSLIKISHPFTAQYVDDFDELPFHLDTLRRHLERFIVVSGPIQNFISRVVRIFRWECPRVTGLWMVLYFTLWYLSQIMTFGYMYIIYKVVMNYYYPSSLKEIRESIKRTVDCATTAFEVTELMDRHGNDKWLTPLVDQLGPLLQVQINDIANLIEIIHNFYHWKRPLKTRATLFLFLVLALICLVADSNFCLKIIYFIVGMTFFCCWPISSRYPKYRVLVTPWRWIFWDIPTYAEWSIQYLQEHSNEVRKTLETQEHTSIMDTDVDHIFSDGDGDSDTSFSSTTSIPAPLPLITDILSFRCKHALPAGLAYGHFTISTYGLRFETLLSKATITGLSANFNYPYARLLEMRKRQAKKTVLPSLSKMKFEMDKLELHFRDPFKEQPLVNERPQSTVVLLENMRGRDRVFNAILGFSGLKWQNLQGN